MSKLSVISIVALTLFSHAIPAFSNGNTLNIPEAGITVKYPDSLNGKTPIKSTDKNSYSNMGALVGFDFSQLLYQNDVKIDRVLVHTLNSSSVFQKMYLKNTAMNNEDGGISEYWYSPSEFKKQQQAFNAGVYKNSWHWYILVGLENQNYLNTVHYSEIASNCISESIAFSGNTRLGIIMTKQVRGVMPDYNCKKEQPYFHSLISKFKITNTKTEKKSLTTKQLLINKKWYAAGLPGKVPTTLILKENNTIEGSSDTWSLGEYKGKQQLIIEVKGDRAYVYNIVSLDSKKLVLSPLGPSTTDKEEYLNKGIVK